MVRCYGRLPILDTLVDARRGLSRVRGMKLAAVVRGWPPIEIIIPSGRFNWSEVVLQVRGVFFAKPYDADEVSAQLYRMAA